ncbi:Cell division protein FtsX [Caloramator mitchellensis]|uniref:Cell division protein FtsX n=1 Tax=Caloramator mitchellensis TaxID=908809 RepID=A0A0R3K2H6_CALMK|nr:permease-like cell division protein FtsX [Caloramator mitchellensis]KRQ87122.1 Cell division protein FtsX [Caloramator mitchellensis]
MAMKIRRLKYYFVEGFKNIIRNRVMAVASISTVAASLFILGIFMTLTLNVNSAVKEIGQTLEIKVYLKDEVTTLQKNNLENEIRSIDGVKEVTYISKEQALEELKKKLGENKSIAEGFEMENPLPQSFIVRVVKPEYISNVSKKISILSGVEKIYDGKGIVEKLIKFTNLIKIASYVLMGLLGTIAAFLISNTIKLAVYARRREISIMKYIGATDWFINWPFIIEGISLGLLGAATSIAVLYLGYSYVVSNISTDIVLFSLVKSGDLIQFMYTKFLIGGIAIGGFGSFLAVKRYLVS